MRKNILKKSLTIGIISMFALLSMFPGVSSTGNSTIEITKPAEGCWYWYNDKIAEGMPHIRIWGPIDIVVDTFDDPDISNLFFYLDNQPDHIWEEPTTPGTRLYTCPDVDLSPFWHDIKVEAEDEAGFVIASDSVHVYKAIIDEFELEEGVYVSMEMMLYDGQISMKESTAILNSLPEQAT